MTATAAPPPLVSTGNRSVDIARIERELATLWEDPDPQPDRPPQVTRACMSNLIIYCATQEQASTIPEEIGQIVRQHPSRVLLLVKDLKHPRGELEAYATALCHMIGGGRQVCSEHVTVLAGQDAVRRLPSVARSLLIGDLPTALWWASTEAPPLGGRLFQELSGMSLQVIYDSRGWLDPILGVLAAANWAGSERTEQRVSDLEWRRLKPWRRLLSQALDPAVLPGALENITEVVIEHGPHALPQTWLLIGWLACRLGWQPHGGKVAPGVELDWAFGSERGPLGITARRLPEGEPEVKKVSIRWRHSGQSAIADFTVSGPGRLAVTMRDSSMPPRTLVMPAAPRASLVAQQLPDLGRDTLFRSTLQVSRVMAETLLG